jgi:hypothetical protein
VPKSRASTRTRPGCPSAVTSRRKTCRANSGLSAPIVELQETARASTVWYSAPPGPPSRGDHARAWPPEAPKPDRERRPTRATEPLRFCSRPTGLSPGAAQTIVSQAHGTAAAGAYRSCLMAESARCGALTFVSHETAGASRVCRAPARTGRKENGAAGSGRHELETRGEPMLSRPRPSYRHPAGRL